MPEAAFYSENARQHTAETVAAIEQATAAEIVVSVRRRSDSYRAVDLAVGFVVSLVVLLLLLFLDQPFPVAYFPLDVTAGFLAGAWLCASLPGLKRLLVPRKWAVEAVTRAAKAGFVDHGISRTRDRTGILVMVSTFERRVVVVPDVGVDPAALGEEWLRVAARLEGAAAGLDLDGFLDALLDARAPLARSLPRRTDDVNELPDALELA